MRGSGPNRPQVDIRLATMTVGFGPAIIAARSELLRQRAPLLLLLADELAGAVGRTAAFGREPERQEPLF